MNELCTFYHRNAVKSGLPHLTERRLNVNVTYVQMKISVLSREWRPGWRPKGGPTGCN
jgi:hypothetical protein